MQTVLKRHSRRASRRCHICPGAFLLGDGHELRSTRQSVRVVRKHCYCLELFQRLPGREGLALEQRPEVGPRDLGLAAVVVPTDFHALADLHHTARVPFATVLSFNLLSGGQLEGFASVARLLECDSQTFCFFLDFHPSFGREFRRGGFVIANHLAHGGQGSRNRRQHTISHLQHFTQLESGLAFRTATTNDCMPCVFWVVLGTRKIKQYTCDTLHFFHHRTFRADEASN
mmetsp:Transcript_3856/g.9656  ORF Transcript_3856/g.9656 Transcript_3856/m.9656 type:complete len:230 (-) Transcript_3856:1312-2001(-)